MRRRINDCEAHHKSRRTEYTPPKLSRGDIISGEIPTKRHWILVEIKEFTYLEAKISKYFFQLFLGVDLTTYPCRRRQPLETPLKRKEQVMAYENTMVVFFIASFVALFQCSIHLETCQSRRTHGRHSKLSKSPRGGRAHLIALSGILFFAFFDKSFSRFWDYDSRSTRSRRNHLFCHGL